MSELTGFVDLDYWNDCDESDWEMSADSFGTEDMPEDAA